MAHTENTDLVTTEFVTLQDLVNGAAFPDLFSILTTTGDACLPTLATEATPNTRQPLAALTETITNPRDWVEPVSGLSMRELEQRTRSDSALLDDRRLVDLKRGVLVIMGGTFDPFHYGHLIAAYAARTQIAENLGVPLEEVKVLFLPAHQNPQKPNPPLASDSQRLSAIVNTLQSHPGFYACPIELKPDASSLWSPSYTSATIDIITRLVSDPLQPGQRPVKLVLLVGAEYVEEFHTWHQPDKIFRQAEIAFEVRAGHEEALELIGPHLSGQEVEARARALHLTTAQVRHLDKNLVRVPVLDISATELRIGLAACSGVEQLPAKLRLMLPDGVLESIALNPGCYLTSSGAERPSLEELVLFGPLEPGSYERYVAPESADPQYSIKKIRSVYARRSDGTNAAPRAQRLDMWASYEYLLKTLRAPSDEPVLNTIAGYLKAQNPLAAKELGETPSGLGNHLREVTQFSSKFFLTDTGASRFPQLLSGREAALLAQVVAPLHDLLKYLGSFSSQVMSDHEVMTAELVRRTFFDKIVLLNGEESRLSVEDVDFIAAVIGDHENIEEEKNRSERIHSVNSWERAQALFFVADVLTGAIVEQPAGGNCWRLDETQLDARFVDLYFRHIDPVKGKIFRPEWGAFTVADLAATLGALTKEHDCRLHGTAAEPRIESALALAALAAINRAEAADEQRWAEARLAQQPAPEKYLTAEQKERVAQARGAVEALCL